MGRPSRLVVLLPSKSVVPSVGLLLNAHMELTQSAKVKISFFK